MQTLITNTAVPAWSKLRLVMLYALRYQKTQASSVASLINLALENGVQREDARVRTLEIILCRHLTVNIIACLCHLEYRRIGPTAGRPILCRVSASEGSIGIERSQGLLSTVGYLTSCYNIQQGVENVYMQHTPHLSQTLENLLRGRLRDTSFPFIDGAGVNAGLQR